jgi:nitrogen regulatory protein PII
MKSIKRVEIIVPSTEVNAVLKMLERAKVEGYTLIEKVRGMGHRGMQDGLGLTDAFSNAMIIWYAQAERFSELSDQLKEILDDSGGICAVSEATWVKH